MSNEWGHVLLQEDYAGLRPGPVVEAIDGPYREMHAQPAHPDDNMDGWQCKVGHWSLGKVLFECIETPNGKRLQSRATATVADNASMGKGDPDWCDIRAETVVTLQEKGSGWGGPVGLLFRFLDSTRYYAAVIDADGQAKVLKRIVANNWDVLGAHPLAVNPGEPVAISVTVEGEAISATIGDVQISVRDGEYAQGMIGVIGAQPATFGPITVSCSDLEQVDLEARKQENVAQIQAKRDAAGQPVLWKQIDTAGFGCARRIRMGDLTGDGQIDFLFCRMSPEKGRVGSITAVAQSGEVLWQVGTPPELPKVEASADVPVQVHDIDGDGKNEVVCAMDGELRALDGATGRVKFSKPLPAPSPIPDVYKANVNNWGGGYDDNYDIFPARAISFADFAGCGVQRDFVVSGSYHQSVAFDSQFNELWRYVNVRGHFPVSYRPRGESRDHMLLGYHHVDADGEKVGRVCLTDHQDAIYVGPLDDAGTGPDHILMAGGEDGVLHLTEDYNIHQRFMGHVQRLAVGKFCKDRPGLSIATVLFHHNRGIVTLYDSTLKRIWTRDYPVVGATLQPVQFDNSGAERMLYSGVRPAQGHAGGLIDGDGDLVTLLPDDGGPGLCAHAQDLDGDGLDELIVWDHDRLWIYHSNVDPDPAKLLVRERPPLYSMSNFQSYWSRPLRQA